MAPARFDLSGLHIGIHRHMNRFTVDHRRRSGEAARAGNGESFSGRRPRGRLERNRNDEIGTFDFCSHGFWLDG